MITSPNTLKRFRKSNSRLLLGRFHPSLVMNTAFMTTTKVGLQTIVTRGPANTGFWIDWGDGSALEWVQHLGVGINVTTTHTYVDSGAKYQKWIGNLNPITYINIASQSYSFDVEQEIINKFANLIFLYISTSPTLFGNLNGVKKFVDLNILYIGDSGSSYTADISNWVTLVNMQSFSGRGTIGLTGDLSTLSTWVLSNQIDFSICANITGNLASLSTWTNAQYINLNNCPGLTIPINSLSTWTSLVALNAYGTPATYSTTVLPAWNGAAIRFDSCGLSTAEVDQLFIDHNTAVMTGGTLNYAGTNDPISGGAPVLAAIAALTGRGVTCVYNT